MKFDVIIPCATYAKRLKGKGARTNIKLSNGETILERQLSILDKYLVDYTAHLILGFDFKKSSCKASSVRPYLNIIENNKYETTNINYGIKLAIPHIEGDGLIIMSGDLVFSHEIFKKNKFNQSKVFIEKERIAHNSSPGCILDDEDYLQNMFWGIPNKWIQIVYIAEKELELFKQMDINERGFPYEIINGIMASGGKFLVEKVSGGVVDIDTVKDLKTANSII